MASGGMKANSKLPKKGAGRPAGPQNSDGTSPGGRNFGAKGGDPDRRKTGEYDRRGPNWETDPEGKFGASLLELQDGAREIRNFLVSARNRDRIERIVEKAFTEAEAGNFRYYEDILNRFGGKPVMTQTNITADLTGDETAALAKQVAEKFEEDGLHLVSDEASA